MQRKGLSPAPIPTTGKSQKEHEGCLGEDVPQEETPSCQRRGGGKDEGRDGPQG